MDDPSYTIIIQFHKASNIIRRYATPCWPVIHCKMNDLKWPGVNINFMSKSVFGPHFLSHNVWLSKIIAWKVSNNLTSTEPSRLILTSNWLLVPQWLMKSLVLWWPRRSFSGSQSRVSTCFGHTRCSLSVDAGMLLGYLQQCRMQSHSANQRLFPNFKFKF